MLKQIFYTVGISMLVVYTGCQEKGSFEKAGEKTDEMIDNVKDGAPILHKKGTAEKAGDAINKTVNDAKRSAEEAADDAKRTLEDAAD